MMPARAAFIGVVAVVVAVGGGEGPTDDLFGHATENVVTIGGTQRSPETRAARTTADPAHEYERRPVFYCGQGDRGSSNGPCIDAPNGGQVVRRCADGSIATDPLFRRELATDGRSVGPWEQVDTGGCPEDPTATVVLTATDFRRLPVTPSPAHHQPADGRNLIGKPVILWTDPAPQTLTTTVLGTPVTVRATPTTWTWDLGDDTDPLTTTDPGHPYPDHTVTRAYTHPGTYTLTLTTTWTGTYQVDGTGPWHTVTGTATTTSTPTTLTAEEAPTRLVADR